MNTNTEIVMADIQHAVIDGPLGVVLILGLMTVMYIVIITAINLRKEDRKFQRFLSNLDDDSWWSTAHGGMDAAKNAETSEGIAGTDAAKEGRS